MKKVVHRKARVLVVEDNPGDARLIQLELEEAGEFVVTWKSSLDDGIEALSRGAMEAVLLDLSLPDSTGVDTITTVLTAARHTPVIVLTGRDDTELAVKALQAGARNYLVKSRAHGELLCRVVRHAIDQSLAEEKRRRDELCDPFTGLPNLVCFQDRLARVLAQSGGAQQATVSILLLNIGNLHTVINSLGHSAADQLLAAVADRLSPQVSSRGTIARSGRDEFAVLLDPTDRTSAAMVQAECLLGTLDEPFEIKGHEIHVSASLGIASGSPGTTEPEHLLRDASVALSHARSSGRGGPQVFDTKMLAHSVAQLQLESELWQALRGGQLCLYYQPIVALNDGHVRGFEALLRWRHPKRGVVEPGDFIPLSERGGLINAVGHWALKEACRQLASWQESFPRVPPLTMSVNISGKQLARQGFSRRVLEVVADSGIDSHGLSLEIAESVLILGDDVVTVNLEEIHSSGVKLQIDDFGTGFSSLRYLHTLSIDAMKIDREFVACIGKEGAEGGVAKTIFALGRVLNVEVIAEGVETPAQLERIRDLGCPSAQGFLFARPMQADAAAEFLNRAGAVGSEYSD